jgi:drug/metabolite transporter (DMT)-like permease
VTSRNGASAWFVLILLSLIWGSSFILMKEGLKGFDPLQLALIRMSVAALCFLPFALRHLREQYAQVQSMVRLRHVLREARLQHGAFFWIHTDKHAMRRFA